MSSVLKLLFTLLFADDTHVFTVGKYVRQLIAIMNDKLAKKFEMVKCKQTVIKYEKNSLHYF